MIELAMLKNVYCKRNTAINEANTLLCLKRHGKFMRSFKVFPSNVRLFAYRCNEALHFSNEFF